MDERVGLDHHHAGKAAIWLAIVQSIEDTPSM
jgi:hypothetical protein